MNRFTRRRFIQKSGLSLLGAAVVMNTGSKIFAAPSSTPFQSVRFAVISDPHVDIKGENTMKMSAYSVECLQRTCEELTKEKDLAFVMVNGDLLKDGEVENAKIVREALDTLSTKTFIISGNHDYEPADPKKHRKGFTYLTSDDFVNFFSGYGYNSSGKRYYAQQMTPGLRLITLDACMPLEKKKWGGRLPDEQLSWLDRQLAAHSHQVNLVFMHHNFIPWTLEELQGGPKQWFCIDNAAAVRAVLERNSKATPIALSGHRHIGLHARELHGVHYFALPSLNSHPMRYALFSISHEQISWKTPMVAVNEKKHLEAREALLNATWWRDEQYSRKNSKNDAAVLRFYENNSMIIGSRILERG